MGAPTRSVAFLDWSNVFLPAKKVHGIRVDALKLRQLLETGRTLTQVHYFSADGGDPGQAKFHAWLQRHGFVVHTRPLEYRVKKVECPQCGNQFDPVCPACRTTFQLPPHKSKMVDIEIGLYLVKLADQYEEAVLVSGDKDYLPVIEWLRNERGKKVSIYSWKDAFSGMLIGSVDSYTYLDSHVAAIKQ